MAEDKNVIRVDFGGGPPEFKFYTDDGLLRPIEEVREHFRESGIPPSVMLGYLLHDEIDRSVMLGRVMD